MSPVAVFQIIAAALAAIASLIGILIALRNFPTFVAWFRSKAQIIAENFSLREKLATMTQSAAIAHQSAVDVKMSVDELRTMNNELRAQIAESNKRISYIESMMPVYDEAMSYLPLVMEHAAWIEKVARAADVDISGREMPALPAILATHIKRSNDAL